MSGITSGPSPEIPLTAQSERTLAQKKADFDGFFKSLQSLPDARDITETPADFGTLLESIFPHPETPSSSDRESLLPVEAASVLEAAAVTSETKATMDPKTLSDLLETLQDDLLMQQELNEGFGLKEQFSLIHERFPDPAMKEQALQFLRNNEADFGELLAIFDATPREIEQACEGLNAEEKAAFLETLPLSTLEHLEQLVKAEPPGQLLAACKRLQLELAQHKELNIQERLEVINRVLSEVLKKEDVLPVIQNRADEFEDLLNVLDPDPQELYRFLITIPPGAERRAFVNLLPPDQQQELRDCFNMEAKKKKITDTCIGLEAELVALHIAEAPTFQEKMALVEQNLPTPEDRALALLMLSENPSLSELSSVFRPDDKTLFALAQTLSSEEIEALRPKLSPEAGKQLAGYRDDIIFTQCTMLNDSLLEIQDTKQRLDTVNEFFRTATEREQALRIIREDGGLPLLEELLESGTRVMEREAFISLITEGAAQNPHYVAFIDNSRLLFTDQELGSIIREAYEKSSDPEEKKKVGNFVGNWAKENRRSGTFSEAKAILQPIIEEEKLTEVFNATPTKSATLRSGKIDFETLINEQLIKNRFGSQKDYEQKVDEVASDIGNMLSSYYEELTPEDYVNNTAKLQEAEAVTKALTDYFVSQHAGLKDKVRYKKFLVNVATKALENGHDAAAKAVYDALIQVGGMDNLKRGIFSRTNYPKKVLKLHMHNSFRQTPNTSELQRVTEQFAPFRGRPRMLEGGKSFNFQERLDGPVNVGRSIQWPHAKSHTLNFNFYDKILEQMRADKKEKEKKEEKEKAQGG